MNIEKLLMALESKVSIKFFSSLCGSIGLFFVLEKLGFSLYSNFMSLLDTKEVSARIFALTIVIVVYFGIFVLVLSLVEFVIKKSKQRTATRPLSKKKILDLVKSLRQDEWLILASYFLQGEKSLEFESIQEPYCNSLVNKGLLKDKYWTHYEIKDECYIALNEDKEFNEKINQIKKELRRNSRW